MYRPLNIKLDPSKVVVFFDFDKTIAAIDTFDDIILRYSINDRWKKIEEAWVEGRIGSKECLSRQLEGVRISKKELSVYLKKVVLDPHFKPLLRFLRGKKIKTIIASDNFDFILKTIFNHNKIRNVRLYCNKVRFSGDRLIPSYPHRHKSCRQCGHCKEKNLLANTGVDSIIFYIGDGRSDICPALQADFVFAKDSLLKYFKQAQLGCFAFKSLKEVHEYLRRSFP
jgi:2-hydroxy-3-keto-5-methylthiopentenyl-1-phosphate phosphatase